MTEPLSARSGRKRQLEVRERLLANLVRSERSAVWGINARATHLQLEQLYVEHAPGVLGGTYLPEAVVTFTGDGLMRPTLTYVAHEMKSAPADADYVGRIAGPARSYGFPLWYVEHLESYARRR